MSLRYAIVGSVCLLPMLIGTTRHTLASEVINESRTLSGGNEVQGFFGYSIDVDGDYVLGGAYGTNVTRGSAFLVDRQAGGTLDVMTATDAAAYDAFGFSVALSGDTAVIGAYGNDDAGNFTGSAYIYDLKTGVETAKLLPLDPIALMGFGYSTAVSGNIAIIGAESDSPSEQYSGSAYLFDIRTGLQLAKLIAPDAEARDRFGTSVAIEGNIAAIGAPDDDSRTGAVYLYDITDPAAPNYIDKLVASDKTTRSRFGESVAVSGDSIVVGATLTHGERGAAYVFDRSTLQQVTKTVDTGPYRTKLGTSVAIEGDYVVVGGVDKQYHPFSNSAFVFDRTTGEELFQLVGTDIQSGDAFGQSVAIQDNEVFVGAWEWNNDRGKIYVFDIPEPASLGLLGGSLMLVLARRPIVSDTPISG